MLRQKTDAITPLDTPAHLSLIHIQHYLEHGFNQLCLVLRELSEGHRAGPDPLHLLQLSLPLLLLRHTLRISQQHMRAEEVLLLLLHHLQAVLEILPAPFHQRVLTQKLPGGFVDEQGGAVLPGRRIHKDARDVEAAVPIMAGDIFGAQILFDICDCDGAHRELSSRLDILSISSGPSGRQGAAFTPNP